MLFADPKQSHIDIVQAAGRALRPYEGKQYGWPNRGGKMASERNGNDITLISACLSAPAYVSGLSDAEVSLLRANLEAHAPPAIIKERRFVQDALAEIARGFVAAKSRIAKRGGLEATDLGWDQPANAA